MARIAEIEVGVTANTKGFEKGAKRTISAADKLRGQLLKAEVAADKFDRRMRIAKQGAVLFAKGAGIAAAATVGLVAKFRQLAEAQLELQLRAGQFGMDPQRLKAIVTTFQDIGIQADSTIDAIQTINERVEEARKGEGTAVEVFQALNINVEKFAKLDVASKFERLSVAFMGIRDSAKRTLATTDLFGDEASKIAGAFKDSVKFSTELRKNLKEVKFDSDVNKAAEKLNKSLNKFGREANKFLAGLEPLITFLAKALDRFNKMIQKLPGFLTGDINTGIGKSTFGGLGSDINELFGGVTKRKGRNGEPVEGTVKLTPSQARAAGGFLVNGRFPELGNIDKTVRTKRPQQNLPKPKPETGLRSAPVPANQTLGGFDGSFEDHIKRTVGKGQLSKLTGDLGALGSAFAPLVNGVVDKLANVEIPIGPQQVIQESNAALTRGSVAAFSAINRAASPEVRLDEQRNIKLDKLIQNGFDMLQAIGGAGKTIIDSVTV